MSTELWKRVDEYYCGLFLSADDVLDSALKDSDAGGLPTIQVSPAQGKLLCLLAKSGGAKNILEIGTLGGYSTIWMARALPDDGRLVTLEVVPKHAEVARANIARAGFADKVEVRLGPAQETLDVLQKEGVGPFDFVFIDADKAAYPEYFKAALNLCRTGAMIVADNVVRDGEIVNSDSSDASIQGIRRFNEIVAAEPRVTATVVQTVGSKGYDGFVIAFVE